MKIAGAVTTVRSANAVADRKIIAVATDRKTIAVVAVTDGRIAVADRTVKGLAVAI